jgi:uncharacterized membrane protein
LRLFFDQNGIGKLFETQGNFCVLHWSSDCFNLSTLNLQEFLMNQRALIAAAAASLLSTVMISTGVNAASHAAAPAAAKEKCYGIAKAGQNDCANLSGTHSCAGQSKVSDDKGEWKYVAAGTCKTMNGMTADEAKKAGMKS